MITPVQRAWWTKGSTTAVALLMGLVLLGGGFQGILDAVGVLIGVMAIVWAGKAAHGFIRS